MASGSLITQRASKRRLLPPVALPSQSVIGKRFLARTRVALGGRMTPSFLQRDWQRERGQGNMDSCAFRRREASRKCPPPPTPKKAKPPPAPLTFLPPPN